MAETPQDFDATPSLDGGDNPVPVKKASTRRVSAPAGEAFGITDETAISDGEAESSPIASKGFKPYVVPVAVAILVSAIIGGAAGAGIAVLVAGNNGSISNVSTNAGVVINDKTTVTPVSAVVAKSSPSVVTIDVSTSSAAGTGSGIVLTSDGYVLTNNHVATLDGASANGTITVQDSSGHLYSASIVGTDPTVDLAVIKLKNASGLTPIEWSDSSKLNVGQTAIAMGAPLGLAGTVTTGIVSALNRSIQIASSAVTSSSQDNSQQQTSPWNLFNFDLGNGSGSSTSQTNYISIPVIQTDAAINPGNSGGALLDSNGRLIGINVAIAGTSSSSSSSSQSGSIGVGFALPANLAHRIADELMANGKATHGLLGAAVADEASVKGSTRVGALIEQVSSGGAAAAVGMQKGDIVIEFNSTPISDASDLTAAVRTEAAGAHATLVYIRGGVEHSASVTLGTFK